MPAVGGIAPASGRKYPGKLTLFVLVTCIVAAMGGLIFGYDIGISGTLSTLNKTRYTFIVLYCISVNIISCSGGVTSMAPFLERFFPSVYRKEELDAGSTNQYCKFNSQTLTMFTSSLYLAASVACIGASTMTRKLGRRLSMLFGGVLFCVGAIINGFAANVAMLIIGRLLLGFGIGFANQVLSIVTLVLCSMIWCI